MKTILFVEPSSEQGRMVIGYQLNRTNYHRCPNGRIRIARFTTNFSPTNNLGYYADIHMRDLIRKWKNKTKENIRRKQQQTFARQLLLDKCCDDVIGIIQSYI
jgi:hypothetical protein